MVVEQATTSTGSAGAMPVERCVRTTTDLYLPRAWRGAILWHLHRCDRLHLIATPGPRAWGRRMGYQIAGVVDGETRLIEGPTTPDQQDPREWVRLALSSRLFDELVHAGVNCEGFALRVVDQALSDGTLTDVYRLALTEDIEAAEAAIYEALAPTVEAIVPELMDLEGE